MRIATAVRGVAFLEAAKGALVVLAGIGALSLIHHDVQRVAEQLVGHLHLNAAKTVPRIFIEYAGSLNDARLATLAAFAALYSAARFIESYGLWRRRSWAEWFAAASAAVYLPFEVLELLRGWSWLAFGALVINLAVVWLMVMALRRPGGHDR
jgi:uncharacterized membrane protein (DUF2068 family)